MECIRFAVFLISLTRFALGEGHNLSYHAERNSPEQSDQVDLSRRGILRTGVHVASEESDDDPFNHATMYNLPDGEGFTHRNDVNRDSEPRKEDDIGGHDLGFGNGGGEGGEVDSSTSTTGPQQQYSHNDCATNKQSLTLEEVNHEEKPVSLHVRLNAKVIGINQF